MFINHETLCLPPDSPDGNSSLFIAHVYDGFDTCSQILDFENTIKFEHVADALVKHEKKICSRCFNNDVVFVFSFLAHFCAAVSDAI